MRSRCCADALLLLVSGVMHKPFLNVSPRRCHSPRTRTRTYTLTHGSDNDRSRTHKEKNQSLYLFMTQVTIIPLRFRFKPHSRPTPVFFFLLFLLLARTDSSSCDWLTHTLHQFARARAHVPQDHGLSFPALQGKQLTYGAVDDAQHQWQQSMR